MKEEEIGEAFRGGDIDRREHTDEELAEVENSKDDGRLREFVVETLMKSSHFESLDEDEKKKLIEREVQLLKDTNKRN